MKSIALGLVFLFASTARAAAPVPQSQGVKTAVCQDGTTYYSRTGEHRGACSGHHGVASWTDGSPVRAKRGAVAPVHGPVNPDLS